MVRASSFLCTAGTGIRGAALFSTSPAVLSSTCSSTLAKKREDTLINTEVIEGINVMSPVTINVKRRKKGGEFRGDFGAIT